jgi:hypothetical protein
MEAYTLDSLLRREYVVDQYESFIWTERFPIGGDFELLVHSTVENRKLLAIGTKLVINESQWIMTVETAENKHDDDGRVVWSVTGRALDKILEDRIAKPSMANLTIESKWAMSGTPGNIIRQVFDTICRNGALSASDKIPFLMPGTLSTPGTIPEPTGSVNIENEIDTVYVVIKQLCDVYGLGVRLIRNLDTSQLYFEVYTGNDRTSTQSVLDPLIFSPDLDNLSNVTELSSRVNYKNVAYVFSKNGSEMVYDVSADPSTSGFERRVLMVKADDVEDEPGPTLTTILNQRGQDALAENKAVSAFDGEIPQSSRYKYGIHYKLGDLVEMQNADGATNNMRITEQIFVSDSEGDRSYPTLAIDPFITAGSWYALDEAEGTWAEADDTWDDQ